MPNSFARLCAGWLIAVGVAGAQAPTVPTDHYGPPTNCPERNGIAVHIANPQSLATLLREQREGAVLSWQGTTITLPSDEPVENIAAARDRVADYADCVGEGGCYWADLDTQWQRAEAALLAGAKAAHAGEKLAVVMDIDETTLSGYCEIKREGFGYVDAMYQDWIVSDEAAVAIPGAQRFFDEAKKLGVAVFFITGRSGVPDYAAAVKKPDQTAATAADLKAAGFNGWTGLVLRDGSENELSTIAYKSGERQRVVDKGYTILVSVGDQWSDLEGKPQAQVSVKLPNPFYFLP